MDCGGKRGRNRGEKLQSGSGEGENQVKKVISCFCRGFQGGNSKDESIVLLPAMARIGFAAAVFVFGPLRAASGNFVGQDAANAEMDCL